MRHFFTFALILLCIDVVKAEPLRIAFLAAESTWDQMGPHNRGAWHAATALGRASLLLRQADGSLVDTSGRTRHLDDFDVVWYHQGDAIQRNSLYQGPTFMNCTWAAGA